MPTNAAVPAVISSTAGSAAEASATVGSGSNEVFVTPQMLVDFFHSRNDKSSPDTNVTIPFGFVPPIGGNKPSSSATYNNGP